MSEMVSLREQKELYRLMSEVISLRERVARAELAAANSKSLSSRAKDVGNGHRLRKIKQAERRRRKPI
jgi:hypothetical protein